MTYSTTRSGFLPRDAMEIRDPIHVFVRLDSDERKVLDSRPFQRLRYIHQLALSYLVYPGATHKRFEHSLGVMELASRVFDVVTRQESLTPEMRDLLEVKRPDEVGYWRRVLRMAALCHDLGHIPFSHAAEDALLPDGWDHERLTMEIIRSEEMSAIWASMRPLLAVEDIVKVAVGPEVATECDFTNWETILSEIIVGDAFGVDRMDYLLRDSHHAGVAYGRFDHYRLIDTLRILAGPHEEGRGEPALGVEEGGLQSAEALLIARYFMYSQVYFHHIRRIYDIHLRDFIAAWLPTGKFSTQLEEHLTMTDNEVTAALSAAERDESAKGHEDARRIARHEHFKVLYERNPDDVIKNRNAAQAVHDAAAAKFGAENVRIDQYKQNVQQFDFPVLARDGRVCSSWAMSEVLQSLPVVAVDYVFIRPELLRDAKEWLGRDREQIIQAPKEPEE